MNDAAGRDLQSSFNQGFDPGSGHAGACGRISNLAADPTPLQRRAGMQDKSGLFRTAWWTADLQDKQLAVPTA